MANLIDIAIVYYFLNRLFGEDSSEDKTYMSFEQPGKHDNFFGQQAEQIEWSAMSLLEDPDNETLVDKVINTNRERFYDAARLYREAESNGGIDVSKFTAEIYIDSVNLLETYIRDSRPGFSFTRNSDGNGHYDDRR